MNTEKEKSRREGEGNANDDLDEKLRREENEDGKVERREVR